MKKFILSLIAFIAATVSMDAQNTQVANLYHEGEVKTYYGSDGFISAHEDAVDGDIITLSTGYFTSPTITKNVTVRGAGMDNTRVYFYDDNPSYFFGTSYHSYYNVKIQSPSTFEGITLGGIVAPEGAGKLDFIKCKFTYLVTNEKWTSGSINLYGCHSTEYLYCTTGSRVACINSIFNHVGVLDNQTSFNCINCIVTFERYGVNTYNDDPTYYKNPGTPSQSYVYNTYYFLSIPSYMRYSSFENCVLILKKDENWGTDSYYSNLPSTVIATNNVGTGGISFENCTPDQNEIVENLADLFKDTETYELTDEAKAKYVGSDDSQVGIYGGMLPFNKITSVPKITSLSVDRKVKVGNKLGIDITVNGE